MTHVGKSISHESARGHVTGAALYTDDLKTRFANVLSAWPVCSPHAHAKVVSIDASEALTMEGVATVLTGDDVPGNGNTGPARQDEPLFPDVVVYHGQAVCWVLAETELLARQAVKKVKVEYEALEPILTIEDAIAKDSFHTKPLVIDSGEVNATLSQHKTLSGEVHVGGQEHFYLEAQAAIVYQDESGGFQVHSSTQHPTETQMIVARVLGLSSHDVSCQSLRMGGAFGGKEVQANAWASVAAVGANKTGRPVRVRLDRQRDMALTGKRHPFLGRYKIAYGDDGEIFAADIELFSDGGWSLDLSEPVMFRAMFHVDNCYRIDHLRVVGRVCNTHKTSQTAFRGFGGPQGMVVIEDAIDRVARATGLPPEIVREKNFYREGDRTHFGQRVTQAERVTRVVDEVKRDADFAHRREAIRRFNETHETVKRGIAVTPVKFGISFTTAFFNQAGALVLLYADGSVQLNHGGTEMGQGLHTKMLQIAADALGTPLESVRMMPTRTDKVPNTSATAASSGTDLNGAAVRDACQQIRERLALVASQKLGASKDDIEFGDGKAWVFGSPETTVSFAELAKTAYLQRLPLFATGYYRTPKIKYDEEAGSGKPFHYFAYGAAITEVEVDRFTGQYTIVRADVVHDVGDSISPLVDKGQVEGGYIQGLGWLTTEELVWRQDDRAKGMLATRGASTYKLPTLGECPEEFHVRLLDRATEPSVIHGSKAVGEPPLMLAISAREALRDAVAAFGSGGKRPEGIPLGCPSTPEAVFWAIQNVTARVQKVAAE